MSTYVKSDVHVDYKSYNDVVKTLAALPGVFQFCDGYTKEEFENAIKDVARPSEVKHPVTSADKRICYRDHKIGWVIRQRRTENRARVPDSTTSGTPLPLVSYDNYESVKHRLASLDSPGHFPHDYDETKFNVTRDQAKKPSDARHPVLSVDDELVTDSAIDKICRGIKALTNTSKQRVNYNKNVDFLVNGGYFTVDVNTGFKEYLRDKTITYTCTTCCTRVTQTMNGFRNKTSKTSVSEFCVTCRRKQV
jgi:hypothetical protein